MQDPIELKISVGSAFDWWKAHESCCCKPTSNSGHVSSKYEFNINKMIWYQHSFFFIVALANGIFKCKICEEFKCSGNIPFEQHLAGQKHLKNVQRVKEATQSNPSSPARSPPPYLPPMSPSVYSPPAMAVNNNDSSPTTPANGSLACKTLFNLQSPTGERTFYT